MKISITIAIALLLAVLCPSSAQVLKKDYEILAKTAILKNTIDRYYPSSQGISPEFLSSAVQEIENTVKNNSYSYELKEIDSILSFKIISILDKSNFQLHGLNETIFAINTSDSLDRYFEININNLLQFVNERIYPQIKDEDKFRLNQFYNTLFAHLNSGFGLKIEFYDKANAEDFHPLDKFYRFQDIVTKEQIGERDHYENIYKVSKDDSQPVDFYRIIYRFECNKLKVEQELLLRTRI